MGSGRGFRQVRVSDIFSCELLSDLLVCDVTRCIIKFYRQEAQTLGIETNYSMCPVALVSGAP